MPPPHQPPGSRLYNTFISIWRRQRRSILAPASTSTRPRRSAPQQLLPSSRRVRHVTGIIFVVASGAPAPSSSSSSFGSVANGIVRRKRRLTFAGLLLRSHVHSPRRSPRGRSGGLPAAYISARQPSAAHSCSFSFRGRRLPFRVHFLSADADFPGQLAASAEASPLASAEATSPAGRTAATRTPFLFLLLSRFTLPIWAHPHFI